MQRWIRAFCAAGLWVLASLVPAAAAEVDAGPIWNNHDAQGKCPNVCARAGGTWDGNWRTVGFSRSVCNCSVGGAWPWRPPPAQTLPMPGPVLRYENTDFWSGDLPDGRVDANSFEDCANQCLADRRCVAFTLSLSGSCYRKGSVGRLQRFSGATSGFLSERGTPPQPIDAPPPLAPAQPPGGLPYARYDGFDLPGNDLAEFPARSVDECAARCLDDGRCAAFTFNRRTGNCIPKSVAAPAVRNDDGISGIVSRNAAAAPALPPAGAGGACSVGGTTKCPGCSVSCSADQQPVCTQAIEGVTSFCARDASCRCMPR